MRYGGGGGGFGGAGAGALLCIGMGHRSNPRDLEIANKGELANRRTGEPNNTCIYSVYIY